MREYVKGFRISNIDMLIQTEKYECVKDLGCKTFPVLFKILHCSYENT